MAKIIPGAVQYPFDAQSDPFFCAVSTALLPALGITEDTPYWCAPNEKYCDHCGGCTKTTLQKHHLMLYHTLLAATGVAFGFDYPEDDEVGEHSLPDVENGWRWPDAFVDSIMALAGLHWKRVRLGAPRDEIAAAVQGSIDAGYPVCARLGGGSPFGRDTAWQVITGYEDGAFLGLDSASHTLSDAAVYRDDLFVLQNWYDRFVDAIVITGRRERTVTLDDVLRRIVETLSHPSHDRLEARIDAVIDTATPDNAFERAAMLGGITGMPIEARWHAAEAFCPRATLLTALTDDDALRGKLGNLFFDRYIRDHNNETHGVCWKIWGELGIGPSTGYGPAPDAGARLLEHKEELKRLFKLVFDNDRAVLEGLCALGKYGC